MSYQDVESAIDVWVERYAFKLLGGTGRSIYLSSENGECCQIWIDAPQSGKIKFHVAAVESKDDEEMKMDWEVPVTELPQGSDNAVQFVGNWFVR